MKVPRLTRPTGPKRPWLAGLLALVVTGLGHVYLRRWLRGFGWFTATFAAILLLVPPEVVEALNTGAPISNPVDAMAPVVVVVASAVDAYLLARQTRTNARLRAANGQMAGGTGDSEAATCPACGKELDADLDFCPWCSTELGRPGPNGPDSLDGENAADATDGENGGTDAGDGDQFDRGG